MNEFQHKHGYHSAVGWFSHDDKLKAQRITDQFMVRAMDLGPLRNAIARALAEEREEAAARVAQVPPPDIMANPAYVFSVTREDCLLAARAHGRKP